MDKIFGFSETEYEFMEFFWDNPGAKTFKELLDYFNNVKCKGWKKQTVSTFLTLLIDKGYLNVDKSKRKYEYSSNCDKEKHISSYLQRMCEDYFDGDLVKFLSAIIGGRKLEADECERLTEYAESLHDK